MPKVIIIEDEIDLIDIYQTQFEVAGIDTAVATNLKDGFELIKKEKPNVVLLDLLLSQKEVIVGSDSRGGYILLDKIMADSELKKIKVVVFSNLDSQKDRKKVAEKGAYEYLIKSEVAPAEIVKIAQEILKGTYKPHI